ncbi:conserved Plasmodium protein, unknown function [Plasmodium ovale curtisi]|uniref:Uncharacterized protein n=1 Tax=Plasmodium ovale curtisi TaxID=864141 RepID=A0A1A8WF10_PLAOA|nr:conserved Plasmodium protein, unknown function [Plasmodium ovale curtisi]
MKSSHSDLREPDFHSKNSVRNLEGFAKSSHSSDKSICSEREQFKECVEIRKKMLLTNNKFFRKNETHQIQGGYKNDMKGIHLPISTSNSYETNQPSSEKDDLIKDSDNFQSFDLTDEDTDNRKLPKLDNFPENLRINIKTESELYVDADVFNYSRELSESAEEGNNELCNLYDDRRGGEGEGKEKDGSHETESSSYSLHIKSDEDMTKGERTHFEGKEETLIESSEVHHKTVGMDELKHRGVAICEEVIGEEVIGEEVSGEEVIGEEVSGEEVIGEEVSGEEVSGEEVIDEEVIDEEVIDEEVSGEEAIESVSGNGNRDETDSDANVEKREVEGHDTKIAEMYQFTSKSNSTFEDASKSVLSKVVEKPKVIKTKKESTQWEKKFNFSKSKEGLREEKLNKINLTEEKKGVTKKVEIFANFLPVMLNKEITHKMFSKKSTSSGKIGTDHSDRECGAFDIFKKKNSSVFENYGNGVDRNRKKGKQWEGENRLTDENGVGDEESRLQKNIDIIDNERSDILESFSSESDIKSAIFKNYEHERGSFNTHLSKHVPFGNANKFSGHVHYENEEKSPMLRKISYNKFAYSNNSINERTNYLNRSNNSNYVTHNGNHFAEKRENHLKNGKYSYEEDPYISSKRCSMYNRGNVYHHNDMDNEKIVSRRTVGIQINFTPKKFNKKVNTKSTNDFKHEMGKKEKLPFFKYSPVRKIKNFDFDAIQVKDGHIMPRGKDPLKELFKIYNSHVEQQ